MSMIRTHIASEPDVLHQLMSSLFNTLLLTPHANHWAITRPILSLMLASEASFAGELSHHTAQYLTIPHHTTLHNTALYRISPHHTDHTTLHYTALHHILNNISNAELNVLNVSLKVTLKFERRKTILILSHHLMRIHFTVLMTFLYLIHSFNTSTSLHNVSNFFTISRLSVGAGAHPNSGKPRKAHRGIHQADSRHSAVR